MIAPEIVARPARPRQPADPPGRPTDLDSGRDFRLTDVRGTVVTDLIA